MKNILKVLTLVFTLQTVTIKIFAGDFSCWDNMFSQRALERTSDNSGQPRAGALVLRSVASVASLAIEKARSLAESVVLQQAQIDAIHSEAEASALGKAVSAARTLASRVQSARSSFFDHKWPHVSASTPLNEHNRYICNLIKQSNAGNGSATQTLSRLPQSVLSEHVLEKCPKTYEESRTEIKVPNFSTSSFSSSFLKQTDSLNREIAELENKLGRHN